MSQYDDLPTSYQVAHINIKPNIILAPMVGVTDSIFRRMILGLGGCGLVSSEMTNAASVSAKALKRHHQLDFLPEERPITMQLSGNEPDLIANAARMVEQLGADILDINCGCPAPKVVKNGGGSGLLRDLPRLETILKEIKRSITIPLTLKMRVGYSDSTINAVEVAKMAEQCGVEHIQVHGRTKEQGYKGLANWDLIRAVKEAVTVPVSGNGDITTIEYGMQKWRESGVDGILIGRGAMQNPWIFRQFNDVLNGRAPYEPDLAEKKAVLLEFFEMTREEMPEIVALGKMKQLAGQFTKGLVGGAQFRQTLYHSHSADEILDNITVYFETLQERKTFGDGLTEADKDLEILSCDAFSEDGETESNSKSVSVS